MTIERNDNNTISDAYLISCNSCEIDFISFGYIISKLRIFSSNKSF